MSILVVEGITDAVFFCEMMKLHLSGVTVSYMEQPGRRRHGIPESVRGLRAEGTALELEFRNQVPETGGGRGKVPAAVTALVRGGVTHLAVAMDLDSNSPDAVVESIRDVVRTLLGGPVEPASEGKFRLQGVTVAVIPMGLNDDKDLQTLGITSHAMEDYLIKMLLLDASLRPNVPQFRQLIDELIGTLRNYGVPFDSIKEMFQLVKPIIKHGFSDTGVVESVFQDANRDTMYSVLAPVIDRLESAVGP